MAVIWCPYTGEEIDEHHSNSEHIIPLALCGANDFTIPVEAKANHALGTSLDEKIAQNEYMLMARLHYDCQGHKKRELSNRLKSEIDGWPGKMVFTRDDIVFRGYRTPDSQGLHTEVVPPKDHSLQSTFSIPIDLFLSFGAKIALASSAFFFGETFRNYGYHRELRELLNTTTCVDWLRKHSIKCALTNGPTSYFWAVPWPKSLGGLSNLPGWTHAINMIANRHIIWTHYTSSEVILYIRLFSSFVWIFNISGQPDKFAPHDEYDLGTVLEIDLSSKNKKANLVSLRSYLVALQQKLAQLVQS